MNKSIIVLAACLVLALACQASARPKGIWPRNSDELDLMLKPESRQVEVISNIERYPDLRGELSDSQIFQDSQIHLILYQLQQRLLKLVNASKPSKEKYQVMVNLIRAHESEN